MFRIVGELLHPITQLRHMHAQVLRRLHIGHAPLLDQAHSLKLELAGKLPSLHDPPPAPSKHLTRCLRNRVQASHKIEVPRERAPAKVINLMDALRRSVDAERSGGGRGEGERRAAASPQTPKKAARSNARKRTG